MHPGPWMAALTGMAGPPCLLGDMVIHRGLPRAREVRSSQMTVCAGPPRPCTGTALQGSGRPSRGRRRPLGQTRVWSRAGGGPGPVVSWG